MNSVPAGIQYIYRVIFGFNKGGTVRCKVYGYLLTVVRCFIYGLGRLDFHQLVKVYNVKFYLRIMYSEHPLLRNLFWSYVAVNASNDEELFAVCTYRREMDIITSINEHFNVS